MDWECITVTAQPEDVDRLTDILAGEDIAEFAVIDPKETAEFMASSIYYDYVDEALLTQGNAQICIYVQKGEAGAAKIEALRRFFVAAYRAEIPISARVETVDPGWMENWKKYFKPFPVGKKFMIKPSWEILPKQDGKIVLEIDPSSSFGTGTHETTRLCLESLEELIFLGAEVLDMGCGSGILGVGAMLLGAGQVTAVDVEADAICATRENMHRNGVDDSQYRVLLCNLLGNTPESDSIKAKKFDVIVANIVANVIIRMAPLFIDMLKKKGCAVVSGILRERRDEVEEAYVKAGFHMRAAREEGEWVALIMERAL